MFYYSRVHGQYVLIFGLHTKHCKGSVSAVSVILFMGGEVEIYRFTRFSKFPEFYVGGGGVVNSDFQPPTRTLIIQGHMGFEIYRSKLDSCQTVDQHTKVVGRTARYRCQGLFSAEDFLMYLL